MYAMCLAHFSDQLAFSCTRPGIPFAIRCELSAARIAPGAAPLPAKAAPAAASATTTKLRKVVRMGPHLDRLARAAALPSIRRGTAGASRSAKNGEQVRAIAAAFRVERPDQRGPRRSHCHGRERACSLRYSGTPEPPDWTLERL